MVALLARPVLTLAIAAAGRSIRAPADGRLTEGGDDVFTTAVCGALPASYLLGAALLAAGGSVLAVGLLHASFNASAQLTATHGQRPAWVALTLLTTIVAAVAVRAQARLDDRGYASAGSVSTLTR